MGFTKPPFQRQVATRRATIKAATPKVAMIAKATSRSQRQLRGAVTPPKFNSSLLQNDGWKMSPLLGRPIFRVYVKLPGGMVQKSPRENYLGCDIKSCKEWGIFTKYHLVIAGFSEPSTGSSAIPRGEFSKVG